MSGTRRRTAVGVAAAMLVVLASAGESGAVDPRAGFQSPLRAGAKPGCRWVQVPAKTSRICNATTGQCRVQTVPSQRLWACGTVRD